MFNKSPLREKVTLFFFFLIFFDSRERGASIVSGCDGSPAFKILSMARVRSRNYTELEYIKRP